MLHDMPLSPAYGLRGLALYHDGPESLLPACLGLPWFELAIAVDKKIMKNLTAGGAGAVGRG
jgi:hypothetical protein